MTTLPDNQLTTVVLNIHPWDQLPDEGTKAFEAFTAYRDMGADRSIKKAIIAIQGRILSTARFDLWCRKFQWVMRARAYDQWLDRQKQDKRAKEIIEMSDRHATLATVFMNKVIARLQQLDPQSLTPDQLIKWFETAARVERMARGESTENIRTLVHHTGSVTAKLDLKALDDDDFDAIHSIINRAHNKRRLEDGSSEAEERKPPTVRQRLIPSI